MAELLHVQPDGLGVFHQMGLVHIPPAVEQIVHFPEFSLGAGRFSCFGR